MPDADLYLSRIDLARYLDAQECKRCGAQSCKELVDRIRGGHLSPSDLPAGRAAAIMTAVGLDGVLPAVPSLTVPSPVAPTVLELNGASRGDPVVVTGNSELTVQVLLAVLSTMTDPMFVAFTDTRGDTLDMALVLGSFTPERVARSLEPARARLADSRLVIPGLAAPMRERMVASTASPVIVGPVCAAEIPLFWKKEVSRC